MLPPAVAEALNEIGEDAISVYEVGLSGEDDNEVFRYAVAQDRVVVTENMSDYSIILRECLAQERPCVPVVFIRKSGFPKGGAFSSSLAARLVTWAASNQEPYVGPHWP